MSHFLLNPLIRFRSHNSTKVFLLRSPLTSFTGLTSQPYLPCSFLPTSPSSPWLSPCFYHLNNPSFCVSILISQPLYPGIPQFSVLTLIFFLSFTHSLGDLISLKVLSTFCPDKLLFISRAQVTWQTSHWYIQLHIQHFHWSNRH